MDNFLTELGIKHDATNSYTPEMNGVAERFNLTALDGIKTLLKSSEVPHKFWGEALLCFTYAWNRICHKDSNKTPFEKYSGRKPSVLHLKPFGCLAYAGVPKQIRKKFYMRAKMGIMMGYAQHTKGYRIWLIDENKLVETINVRFDENKRGINFRQQVNSNLGYNLNLPDYDDDFDRVKDSLTSRLVSKTSTETPSTSEKPDVSSDNHSLIPCTEVKWIRNIGRKVTGSNVYYSIEGEATRLKSFNEIERYYSDFATNRDDRVSMGGFITFIDETPISWRTFKQKSVSLSTMEADMITLKAQYSSGSVSRFYTTDQGSISGLGENASQAAEIVNGVYGADTVKANCVQFWFCRFRSGIFDVKDAPCTGRPVVENVDKISEIIEVDRHVSSCSIVQELKIDHKIVLNHLRKVKNQ
ncbi:retrovirus-related Pol polyprotein from transposon TNT 1-94 [Trichonephila clavipes]|nr:retrovirus-related Pol polyprotein from transposon TNT 1-94 [Trichonephila clavipes]